MDAFLEPQEQYAHLPKLPPGYVYSKRHPFEKRQPRTKEEEEKIQKAFFQQMRKNMESQLPPEKVAEMQRLGEKLHAEGGLDTQKVMTSDKPKVEIDMEESVAWVSENLKAGLLPTHLTEDEHILILSAYGHKWYEEFGYTWDDLDKAQQQTCEDAYKSTSNAN